ncbi:GTPase HflX [Aciduricibacillus chroicocephali]|uniref:GTPase HflX n=1 Tax=Aciduricibacillus chroicocephali TaxID=3054939 RepID=A0ABY9KYW8_9BACI|nr:GTPase HflX [Bacillaceae bacterium 44XB]
MEAEFAEKVIIIGVKRQTTTEDQFHSSLDELVSLTDTAGGTVIAKITQNREKIHPATYLGEGKVEEIAQQVEELEADLVISNDELSPGQLRNLSAELGVRVIDRSQLILDIFAQRANTKEGKLQVELAQLEYLLPRLRGKGVELSRLGAGIGTRGPGETKLETDQRHIRNRIHEIKRRLQLAVKQREQYRKRRKTNEAFQIALVGYTNAGKSTIFNKLAHSDTLAENKLFATLDPLTRQIELPSGFKALLTDTVGFLQKLPTALIAAFRSTLEEAKEADLIVHVVDGSHPDKDTHQKTVLDLLSELEADAIPRLTVYNKKDCFESGIYPSESPSLMMSAYEEKDIELLREKIEGMLKEEWLPYCIEIEPSEGKVMDQLERETIVQKHEFAEESGRFIFEGYMRRGHPLNRLLKE